MDRSHSPWPPGSRRRELRELIPFACAAVTLAVAVAVSAAGAATGGDASEAKTAPAADLRQRGDAETIQRLLAAIREEADAPTEAPFTELARLETPEALAALRRALGLTRKEKGYAMLFRGIQRFAGLGESGEDALAFAIQHAEGNEEPIAVGAVPTLWAFGERGRASLRRVAETSRLPRARAVAIGSLRRELRRAASGDAAGAASLAALQVVLGGVAVPGSGSREEVAVLLRAFTSPAHFATMGRYVASPKSDRARALLIVASLAGHDIGTSEAVDAGVRTLIERAVDTRDPALQYEGLRSAAAREVPVDPSRVLRLASSRDPAVRRAAYVAGLRGDTSDDAVGSGKRAAPFRVRELCAHADAIARQAGAVGLGQRRRGSLPAQESRELLYSLLTDDDLAVRLEALRSLNALRSKESIPHLIRLLEVETGRLRGDARSALARLVGRDLGLVPGPWQRLWDREGAALRLPSEEEALRLLAEAENPRAEGSRALFYGIRIDSERLTFVVDTSGSMLEKAYTKETRLQVAQRELTGAIESLANGALFHVIAFAEVPRPLSESPSTASDRTRARMIEAVGRLRAGGGTNVYRALQEAFAVDGIDTVYLVSDGDPTVGRLVDIEALRREVGRWNSTRGLVLHCVAVGQPHELLQNLARDHGGTYRIVQ